MIITLYFFAALVVLAQSMRFDYGQNTRRSVAVRDLAMTRGNQHVRQLRQWSVTSIARSPRLARETSQFHSPLNMFYWCRRVDSTGGSIQKIDRLCFSQRVNFFGLHADLRAMSNTDLRTSVQLPHSFAFNVDGRSISEQNVSSVIPVNRVNEPLTMLPFIMNRALKAPELLHNHEIGDFREVNKLLVISFKAGVNNAGLVILQEIMSRNFKTPSLLLNQKSCVIFGQSVSLITGRVNNLGLETLLQKVMNTAFRASALPINSRESRARPAGNTTTITPFLRRVNMLDRVVVANRASRDPALLHNQKQHATLRELISTEMGGGVYVIDSLATLREMIERGLTAPSLISHKSRALCENGLPSSLRYSPRIDIDGLRTIGQNKHGLPGTYVLLLSRRCQAISEQEMSSIVSFNTSVNYIGFLTMLRERVNRYSKTSVLPLNPKKRTTGWSPVCGATRHCCLASFSSVSSDGRQQHVVYSESNNAAVAHGVSDRHNDKNTSQLSYARGTGNHLVCGLGLHDSQGSRRTESLTEGLACVVTLLTKEYQRILANRNVPKILQDVMSDNNKPEKGSHKEAINDGDSKTALIEKGPINAHDIQSGQDDNGKLSKQLKSGTEDNPKELAPSNDNLVDTNGVMELIVVHWGSNLRKTLPGLSGAFLKSGLEDIRRREHDTRNDYGHLIKSGLYDVQWNADSHTTGHESYDSNSHMRNVCSDAKGYVNHLADGDSKNQMTFDSEDNSEDYASIYGSEYENYSMCDSESDCDFMYESESENGSVCDSDCESDLERVEEDDNYLELVQQHEQENLLDGNNNMVENPAPIVPLLPAIPQQVQEHALPNQPVIPQGNQPGPQDDAPGVPIMNALPNVENNPQELQPIPVPQDEAPLGAGAQQLPHAPGHGLMMHWFAANGLNPHVALVGPQGNQANQGPQDEAPMGGNPHHFPIHHAQDQLAVNGNAEIPDAIPANGVGIAADDVGIDEAPPFGLEVPALQVPPGLQQGQNPHDGQNPQEGQNPQLGQHPQDGENPQEGQNHQQGQNPQQGNHHQQQPHAHATGPFRKIIAAARYVKRKLSRRHHAVPMYVPGAPREERPPIGLDEAPPLIGVPMLQHPHMDEDAQPRGLCACFAFLLRHHGNPVQEYPLQNEQREEFEEQIPIAGQEIDGMELEDEEEHIEAVGQPVEVPEEQMEDVALPIEVF